MADDYTEEREIVNEQLAIDAKRKASGKFAKKWKAVMERPSGAELRIRRQANKMGYVNARKISRGDAEVRRMFAKF